jgi:SGNH domain (fused to AT3 domains)
MRAGQGQAQWFMGPELNCIYFTKAYSIERRRPLQQMLEDMQRNNSNFHVLDLFPVLCPEDVCRVYNEQGVFLYRDEFSHLSIEADYLARPLFLAVVNEAIKASNGILLGAKARGEAGSR